MVHFQHDPFTWNSVELLQSETVMLTVEAIWKLNIECSRVKLLLDTELGSVSQFTVEVRIGGEDQGIRGGKAGQGGGS